MPREPIPRRAKEVKKAPTDYTALVQPSFKSTQAVGHRKKEEEAKKKADAAAKVAATPKKKLTAKQKAGKPTYAKMIAKALVDLQDRSGSSAAAISKHIEANYGKYLPDNFKIFLRRALRNAVEDDILRHEGARYRLSKSGKYKLGLKKRKVKKVKKSSSSSSKDKKRSSRSKSPARSSSRSRSKSPSKKNKKSSSKKTDTKKKTSSSSSSSKAKEAKRSTRSSERRSESSSSSSAKAAPKNTPAGYDHVWHYQEQGQWKPYDSNASDVVEKAYLDYKKNPGMCDVRAVKSGQWQYQVDFLNNQQTNIQHENHTSRAIRRVPL